MTKAGPKAGDSRLGISRRMCLFNGCLETRMSRVYPGLWVLTKTGPFPAQVTSLQLARMGTHAALPPLSPCRALPDAWVHWRHSNERP